MAECYEAHRLLEDIFNDMCGLQQPPDPTIEMSAEMADADRKQIKMIDEYLLYKIKLLVSSLGCDAKNLKFKDDTDSNRTE
jgi:hypothetical protein